jgi:hypothetical protein
VCILYPLVNLTGRGQVNAHFGRTPVPCIYTVPEPYCTIGDASYSKIHRGGTRLPLGREVAGEQGRQEGERRRKKGCRLFVSQHSGTQLAVRLFFAVARRVRAGVPHVEGAHRVPNPRVAGPEGAGRAEPVGAAVGAAVVVARFVNPGAVAQPEALWCERFHVRYVTCNVDITVVHYRGGVYILVHTLPVRYVTYTQCLSYRETPTHLSAPRWTASDPAPSPSRCSPAAAATH